MKSKLHLSSGIGRLLILAQIFLPLFVKAQSAIPFLTLNTEMHTGNILKLSSDESGRVILTTGFDKTAKLWDAESGQLLHTYRIPINQGNEGMLMANAMAPDGKTMVIGGWTGYDWDHRISLYVFDVESEKMKHRIKGLPDVIKDLAFSPDGKYLVVSMVSTGGIRVFKSEDWSMVESYTDYKDNCNDISFDRAGNFATVSYDGKIRLYNNDLKLIAQKRVMSGSYPASLSFSPDGKFLAVGYRDADQIQVFDGANLKLLYEPDISGTNLDGERVVNVSFSADGKSLAAGYSYNNRSEEGVWFQIRIWAEGGRGGYHDYPAGRYGIMDISPMVDGSFFFSGGLPDFGRIGTDGKLQFTRCAETYAFTTSDPANNYTIKDKANFKTNESGMVVGATPFGAKPWTFSLASRTISPGSYAEGRGPVDSCCAAIVTGWAAKKSPEINGRSTAFLETNERTLAVDISSDARKIVFGGDFNIYCTDEKGKVLWKSLGQSAANSINISGNDRVVVVGMGDGTLRWYNMADGSLLFSLFVHPDNKRWVLWSPDGYFDCAQGADDLIGWHVNQGPNQEALYFPASQFFEKFYLPNLGARILEGEEITGSDVKMASFKLPPRLTIKTPGDGGTVRGFKSVGSLLKSEQETVEVTVEATDQGGGIDEILLYHNGKLTHTTQAGFTEGVHKGAKSSKSFTVDLVDGNNVIRATAFNQQRTEAIPVEISITYSGQKIDKPDLFLLIVGLNEYRNPKYNLNFAVADAEAFRTKIEKGSEGMFNQVHTVLLTNSGATRGGILLELDAVAKKAGEEDVFVFYYAGHGVMSEGLNQQFYIIPHEVVKLYGDEQGLVRLAISASELKQASVEIKARKQLFVLDACQSGGMTGMLAARGAAEEKAVNQLARSTGTYWLAASGTEQFAGEFAQLGHGIFTYCLLEGLSGKADGQSDKKVTVQELSAFLNDQVPVVSKQYKGAPQFPNTFGYGQDFPIIILK